MLKTLMWSLTPPATMRLCIPSLGLRRDWASRWSPARYSEVVSLAGFRGRPWIQTPQSLTGQILLNTQLFRQANPAADLAEPDLGCSAPVNMRRPPPSSPCASLIAQAAIDVLTERFELEDEVIDVYRPLPRTPFNRVGRYRRPVLDQA